FAGRHRRHCLHPDHQCAGSGDPRRVEVGHEACLERRNVRAAPGAAAVAELRPSGDRWRRRRALHRLPRATARRPAPGDALSRSTHMADIESKVPDIGGHGDVPVIEILVAVGDAVKKDQGLVTLESDKATMEVPAVADGTIKALKVKLGDTVSEGAVIAVIEGGAAAAAPAPAKTEAPAAAAASAGDATKGTPPPPAAAAAGE